MFLRKLSFAVALAIAGSATAFAFDDTSSKLDTYFEGQIAEKKSPSVSVAIVKNGTIAYAKAFGFADLENDVPATPESVYRVGSITKQFTAAMIMQLVNGGKLRLDEPLQSALPDMPEAWAKITIRQLLNHTSGIKAYTELKGLFDDAAMKPTTPAGIIKTVEKEPLDFAPGTKWHYNNTAYEVLGMIIEKLDSRTYGASLHARILDPLGMTSTYFTSERTVVKHRAQGYDPDGAGFRHAPYLNMDWPYAAGSIESTTLDLAKWDAALYGDKVLPQSSLKQMWSQTVLADGEKRDYGFGWELAKLNGVDLVQHGGGIHGFVSYIRRAPQKGLTVIVLLNNGGGDSEAMAVQAMGIVDPSLNVLPPKAIADLDKALTRKARAVFDSILAGNLDRTKLTPQLDKLISPEMEHGVQSQFTSMGKLTGFDLISSDAKAGSQTRTYLVTLGTTVLKFTIQFDANGRVSLLNFHP